MSGALERLLVQLRQDMTHNAPCIYIYIYAHTSYRVPPEIWPQKDMGWAFRL